LMAAGQRSSRHSYTKIGQPRPRLVGTQISLTPTYNYVLIAAWKRMYPLISLSLMNTFVFIATIAVLASSVAARALTQESTRTRAAFDVVSVKASALASSRGPTLAGPCAAGSFQIDPRRFVADRVTPLRLITWAYGIRDCRSELG